MASWTSSWKVLFNHVSTSKTIIVLLPLALTVSEINFKKNYTPQLYLHISLAIYFSVDNFSINFSIDCRNNNPGGNYRKVLYLIYF